jgi:predicted TIM-barrel fold metal-dependent hydrolase
MTRFEKVLERVPDLRAQVCHMGAYETDRCFALMERYPGLHLDTTMAMTRASIPYTLIDPAAVSNDQVIRWQDRVIYGSDYPNLPYPYEEERRDLLARALPESVLVKLFRGNAVRLYELT